VDKLSQNIKRETIQRKQLIVSGTVQGVGFRPFVYCLAQRYALSGYVANRSSDVIIDIEAKTDVYEQFFAALQDELPAPAMIEGLETTSLPTVGYTNFRIRKSVCTDLSVSSIPPDICICKQCLRELFDPSNRRYRYPFINCTHCGPRYTITSALPYDRPHTSMRVFDMCSLCQQEYDDPSSRRFHAQPNACPVCGPRLMLVDNQGRELPCKDIFTKAGSLLRQGNILAMRGLGGFQLVANAKNQQAVERLRMRKHRWQKPFAVMVASLETARRFCYQKATEEKMLCSEAHPIVLARMHNKDFIADAVSPGDIYCGIMLPYTPLHHLLLEQLDAVVMTSGNLSEEPIAIHNQEALERLAPVADYFLLHNRDIVTRCDDSVVRLIDDQPQWIRRARGLVPFAIPLSSMVPDILAVGADLKNTICIAHGNKAYPSQHIGDLSNLFTRQFFTESITHAKKIHRVDPKLIAHDLHPGYYSTQWALQQQKTTLYGVQHHHAHIAACLVENNVRDPVIGFALDGTGYGTDGTIWGGEVLLADCQSFQRIGHLQVHPLPGGDQGVIETWRMAVSHFATQNTPPVDETRLSQLTGVDEQKIRTTWRMVQKKFNCIPTSSMGRLFDAVAALLGVCSVNSYEGQAAIELEKTIYRSYPHIPDHEKLPFVSPLPFVIENDDSHYVIKTEQAMNRIVELLQQQINKADIALKFHRSLVLILTQMAILVRQQHSVKKVALSGGCFQNIYLSKMLVKSLSEQGFTVYFHRQLPCNDGGISVGQAVVAANNQPK
jgi:hydrogenase maturation protein HypF